MKKCNKCGFIGHLDYFVKSSNYKDGVRPMCKPCWTHYYQLRKNKIATGWTPRFRFKKDPLRVTDEGIDLLIKNGYAKNREEARMYLKC